MKVRTRMDSGLNALILGFFATSWFAWGRAEAGGPMSLGLGFAMVLALAVAVLGALRGFRGPRTQSALAELDSRRQYGILAGIEFGLIFLGALVLAVTKQPAFLPVWMATVVGLHFFLLAPVVGDPALKWLGAVVTMVALGGLIIGIFTQVLPSSVVGPGAGLALLVFAITSLAGPMRAETFRGDAFA